MSREVMKEEALEALVNTDTKQSMARMLASWMRNRHGVDADEQKISVLIEYVVRDASDFSPLLTDVITGLVAMLNGAEHRICDLEQEVGAALREVAHNRNVRQKAVHSWCKAAFGERNATHLPQRGLRLIEEALELAQACGCDREQIHKYVDYVYSRPVGTIHQEIGGLSITLLALSEAAGFFAEDCEVTEWNRLRTKPLEDFRKRNEDKDAAGFKAP